MSIRDGSADDHDAVVEVWRAATTAFLDAGHAGPGQEDRVRRQLAARDAFLLVAEADDHAVVGAALAMDGREDDGAGPPIPGLLHVSMVYVAPARWGEGVGRALMDELLASARARGYVRAQLWTHAHNERAQRLYERQGFAATGREQTMDGLRIVHYARDL